MAHDRRRPPFLILPRFTRCEPLGCTYLRWGSRLWQIYDAPVPAPAEAEPMPWPVAAFRILALATVAWVVAVPLLVASVGETAARFAP